MFNLKTYEWETIESLLQMGSGYVLDFSDRTFDIFIQEATGKSIYCDAYSDMGISKANRLRCFFKKEPRSLSLHLLNELLRYGRTKRLIQNPLDSTTQKIMDTLQFPSDLIGVPLDQLPVYISQVKDKSYQRINNGDYSGALTSNRSLLESICRYILNNKKILISKREKGEMPTLIKKTFDGLHLNTHEDIKMIRGGITAICIAIGRLSNDLGDRHGQDSVYYLSDTYALLHTNLTFTISDFLIREYIKQHQY